MKAWIEVVKRNGKIIGYRVRWRDVNGKRHYEKGIWSKSDAVILRDKINQQLRCKQLGIVDTTVSTAELFDKWITDSRMGVATRKGKAVKEISLVTYQSSLKSFLAFFPQLSQITEEGIKEWKVSMMKEKLMPWSITGRLRIAKTFLGWCRRRGHMSWDAFEEVGISRPPALPRYYDDQEIAILEEAAVGDPFHLALRLGYKAGLRRGEILRFDKRDVRWFPNGTAELMIWADESKNGEFRTVPLARGIVELLGNRGVGRIYPGWSKQKFAYHWAKLKMKAGIKEPPNHYNKKFKQASNGDDDEDSARFHDLRHTFCRIYLESGAGDIQKLSRITGHKSLDVLNRIYSHFQTQVLHDSIEIMEARPKFEGLYRGKQVNFDVIRGVTPDQAGTSKQLDVNEKEADK